MMRPVQLFGALCAAMIFSVGCAPAPESVTTEPSSAAHEAEAGASHEAEMGEATEAAPEAGSEAPEAGSAASDALGAPE